jgi:hypothetical protein
MCDCQCGGDISMILGEMRNARDKGTAVRAFELLFDGLNQVNDFVMADDPEKRGLKPLYENKTVNKGMGTALRGLAILQEIAERESESDWPWVCSSGKKTKAKRK